MDAAKTYRDLEEEIKSILKHGDSMTMPFIFIKGSNEPLQIGFEDGTLMLDLVKEGAFDFARCNRFRRFCKLNKFPYKNLRWGSTRLIRASIGNNEKDASLAVRNCYSDVYGINREVWLTLKQYNYFPVEQGLE